jgi:peroxiredoxin
MFGRRRRTLIAAGAPAPSFELLGLDATTRSLKEILSGGPVLLIFYKISCPVCQFTLPFLQRLSANPSLQVIGISQDDLSATRSFTQRLGVTFPTLLDRGSEGYPASNAYGLSSVPALVLVESDGSVTRAFNGFSKRDLEEIGARAGVAPFAPGEHVPEWKAG